MTDPVRNFKFLVTFNPTTEWGKGDKPMKMGFVSLSGLTVTTEPTAFTPITLSKGVMLGQDSNPKWMKRLFSVLTPSLTTGVGQGFRTDIDIQVLSHPNPQADTGAGAQADLPENQHTSLRFRVYNAWISSLSYSNLDAGANTLMVEEMSLVHEGWDVQYASTYTATGSADGKTFLGR